MLMYQASTMSMHHACMQANAGPWVRLAEETGAVVKWWRVSDSPPFSTSLSDLKKLLSSKTKIVAFPHVSNLLGEVVDVGAAVKMIRAGPAGQLTIYLPVLL